MTSGLPVEVRPATPEDASTVEHLLLDENLQSEFVPDEFLVAEDEDEVVGCARLIPLPGEAHELASLAVAPEHRGRGIGHRLIERALEHANGRVEALALDPAYLAHRGFAPTEGLHPKVLAKLDTCCAGRDVTPMALEREG